MSSVESQIFGAVLVLKGECWRNDREPLDAPFPYPFCGTSPRTNGGNKKSFDCGMPIGLAATNIKEART